MIRLAAENGPYRAAPREEKLMVERERVVVVRKEGGKDARSGTTDCGGRDEGR